MPIMIVTFIRDNKVSINFNEIGHHCDGLEIGKERGEIERRQKHKRHGRKKDRYID